VAHGGFGVEAHAEQQRRAGDLWANRPLQHPGRTPAGMQSELLETSVEQCGRPGDANVGGQRQVEPGADGRAVDRCDGGQLAIAHGHEAVVEPHQPRLRRSAARGTQRAEVGTGAERLACSGDHHGVHLGIGFGLLDGGAQQRRHLAGHRVTSIWVVDSNERDVTVDAAQHQVGLGHRAPPLQESRVAGSCLQSGDLMAYSNL
jgi:hypothetical protein